LADTAESQHLAGVSVSTQWTWPQAWRAYLAMGMWLYAYKDSLTFVLLPSTGRPCCHATTPRLAIWSRPFGQSCPGRHDGPPLAQVERDGDALTLVDIGNGWDTPESLLAGTTLCLELAARGWPMHRHPLPPVNYSDAGLAPEVLAGRILRWADYAREQGWLLPADLPPP
jgi:hypothetical protein